MENISDMTSPRPIIIKASVSEAFGSEHELTFNRRTIITDPDSDTPAESGLGRICRGIDHIYESFERNKSLPGTKRSSVKLAERPRSVRITVLPVIDLSRMLDSIYPAKLENGGSRLYLTDETAEAVRSAAIHSVSYGDIAGCEGALELGDIPAVRDAVAEVLADSAKKAAGRALLECKKAAFETTVISVSEGAFYVNLDRDTGKSFAERIVLLKEGLVPSPTLRGDIYGSPYYAEHPGNTSLNAFRIRHDGDRWFFERSKINIDDLVSPISRLVVFSDKVRDGEDAEETISMAGEIPIGIRITDIFDPLLAPLFDTVEKTAGFIYSEAYSEKLLVKKIQKSVINEKALIGAVMVKLGIDMQQKVHISAYSPTVPVYAKPRVKHSYIGQLLDEIGDGDKVQHNTRNEFKGRHGETFNIEKSDINGKSALCSIAAVIGGSREGAVILEAVKKQFPPSFDRLEESAVNNIRTGVPQLKSDRFTSFYGGGEQLCAEGGISSGSTYSAPADTGLFQKLRHTLGINRIKFHGYDMNNLTAEEISNIVNNLGILDSSDYIGERKTKDPMDPSKTAYGKFRWSTVQPEGTDHLSIRVPEILRPFVQGAGTMIEKPGNVTWYYPMRADDPSLSLDRECRMPGAPGASTDTLPNAYYEEDARFHTISQNYEFFNTKAIRKYMGFAAPFIGPAYDTIQSYAADPDLETETPTVSFKDNIREMIFRSTDVPADEEISLVVKESETLADRVRKYGWFDGLPGEPLRAVNIIMKDVREAGKGPSGCTAPYHELGSDEYDTFLDPRSATNSYASMDRIFALYMELGESKFKEYMETRAPFETDWFNPFTTAKDGFTRYLAKKTSGNGFELLPKEKRLDPKIPRYYEDSLSFENIEKKNSRDENAPGSLKNSGRFYGGYQYRRSEPADIYTENSLARPLGIEPYTEPFGSSRTGELVRPLESLRFLNTLSRSSEELKDRLLSLPEDTGPEI